MAQQVLNFPESTASTQVHKVTIKDIKSVISAVANIGNASIDSIVGDEVTIRVSGGTPTRIVQTGGVYTPASSRTETDTRESQGSNTTPTSISYNSGGFVGTLTRTGTTSKQVQTGGSNDPGITDQRGVRDVILSRMPDESIPPGSYNGSFQNKSQAEACALNLYGTTNGAFIGIAHNPGGGKPYNFFINPVIRIDRWWDNSDYKYQVVITGQAYTKLPSDTRTWRTDYTSTYSGAVTKPASDTRAYQNYYKYSVILNYSANATPTVVLDTTNNRTLYENDTLIISGNTKDADVGNVVSTRYSLNGGVATAINSAVSTGANIPFNKTLSFKNGMLYDGETAISGKLVEGSQYTLKVWATDDMGGTSAEQIRNFYVVPNRPATLTINPFNQATDLIDTDEITVSGNVVDPDGGEIKVAYKIANGAYVDVYNGSGGDFDFPILLSDLEAGVNRVTVQAIDMYGALSNKTLDITKGKEALPLKNVVARYKLLPPNGTAKGVILWIQRETGDLEIDLEISMTNLGEPELFVPMIKNSTAFVSSTIEEDEFTFEAIGERPHIVIKINMSRNSTESNKGITLISGVLS